MDVAAATPSEFAVPAQRDKSLIRVIVALCGLACLPIGVIWDISHHMTIGRDTFWTPAHILIQLGGIVPALLFTALAFKMTFFPSTADRDASVNIWGVRAPIGVWVTFWGALAMVSSAPFDDWWHNTYGLDVKIVSPPHTVLGIGMLAVGMGVLLFVFSAQNRAVVEAQKRLGIFCAVAVGLMLAMEGDFTTEYCWPNLQHTAMFYHALCGPFLLLLVLAARAARIRGAATIAAATYMTLCIAMILVLPLFPAHPKLGPIFNPVDHMVPPMFPLVLIVPAIAIDLIEWKFGGQSSQRLNDWLLVVVLGAAYLLIAFPLQWNFSRFLLSSWADNRLFTRSSHWSYWSQPGGGWYTFWTRDRGHVTIFSMVLVFIHACIATRIGLWLGNYLLRLKR
jgi:hypothetical protein